MTLDLRLDGGRLLMADGEVRTASIGIREGRIVAMGELEDVPAVEVIDLDGLLVLPGIIDTHVHLGFTDLEREAETETRSAVLGGVTTTLVYYRSLDDYDRILADFIELMERRSHSDFAVHLGILHDRHLERMDQYVRDFGIRSIKMYTTYKGGELRQHGVMGQDDGFIFDVFRALSRRPHLIGHVHCENDDMARRGQARWIDPDSSPVQQWSQARPPIAEAEAVQRVGLLARETGARLYVPHVSSQAALKAALDQRASGAELIVETCPHYLLADELADAGLLAKVNPPIRSGNDAEVLAAAFNAGRIDTVGTDHAALMRADKVTPGGVVEARPGFPGVGTLLPALMHAVNLGRLQLRQVVAAQARAAAVFGLTGKGTIAPGAWADLVAVDMSATRRVTASMLQAVSDFSPLEGRELQGWPVLTLLRGRVVARSGQLIGDAGGRYLRRWRGRHGHPDGSVESEEGGN